MPTFEELRQQLQDRRGQAERARDGAAAMRGKFLRLEARDAPKDEVDHARGEALRLRAIAMQAGADELLAIQQFGAVDDPRTSIAELKDRIPILMFPVRIETRFVSGPPPQLLVRVYPDDCLVDTFVPRLSEDEARAARLYWQNIWAAGGQENQQRGAWRQLAGTSGAGRAQWIVSVFTPIATYPEPVKREETDIVLVIVVNTPLPEAELVKTYWVSVWKAAGDRRAVEEARNTLVRAVGAARADALIAVTRPVNFDGKPAKPGVDIQAALLCLPDAELMDLELHSWSSAARCALLPDRFAFLGYYNNTKEVEVLGEPVLSPLVVSPDPSLPDPEQLQQTPEGELIFPKDMRWMVDFERAVAVGMGFRIGLNADQAARGFDRAIVAGVRLSADEKTAQDELENLFRHHRYSRTGLAIVPQGTPTNNTDVAKSGHSRVEDADVSFNDQQRGPLWTETSSWDDKADGQWLAEFLGVANATFQSVHDSDRRDVAEARALNTALWPATLRFWMQSPMNPFFTRESIEWTRDFFTGFVSGRGPLPAIRIGSQPYGILPATPYSRSEWFVRDRPGSGTYFDRLATFYSVLTRMAKDWRGFTAKVAHVGRTWSAPQMLLDIVAAHPGSVEHTWRAVESDFVYRQRLADGGWTPRQIDDHVRELTAQAKAHLVNLGYTGPDEPSILLGYFHLADLELGGPLVDDRPLSETAPVRAYTLGDDDYFGWLADAAHSRDQLMAEAGFKDGTPPKALLYRFLHAALLAGQANALFLELQIAAIRRLKKLPTARLERVLTEHLDCCAYRLDAWLTGVVRRQLVEMRGIGDGGVPAPPAKGIYLGAYAWVEDLAPDPRVLKPATVDPAVRADFPPLAAPLLTDSTNQGYIHTPSLNHAVTAAVLRNGYISNADRNRPDTFAVNLTSERVRTAMSILEGLRGGQSMGALLGYQFERGLHDRQTEELDQFILSIRFAFPLSSNRMTSTKVDKGAIESIEARNVVDGLALVNHIREKKSAAYPFAGIANLRTGDPKQHAAISAEAQRLVETWDAVADLAVSEGVFQAVQGNFDRVGAMLDSLSKGYFPPEPQIVRTPVEGTGLTHRVGLHLKAGLGSGFSPVSGLPPTPRSLAEPAVNEWIASLLPPLDQIGCIVHYRDGANAARQEEVKLLQLKLQPADLLQLAGNAQEELDERITALVADKARPDAPVTLAYMQKDRAALSLFEALPLVHHLRRLTRAARPLAPTDLARPNDAKAEQDQSVFADRERIQKTFDALTALKSDLAAFAAGITTDRAAAVAKCDLWIHELPERFGRAALFAIPQSGWSFAYEFRKSVFLAVRAKAAEVIDRWNRRLADHDALIAQYEALPATATDAERFALLTRAESTVTTGVTAPLPSTPAAYRAVVKSRHDEFAARRDQFVALRDSTRLLVKDLLADFAALLPVTPFDLTEISLNSEVDRCITFAEDLLRVVNVLIADADRRGKTAQKLLDRHDAAATATARVEALTAAAKALLGDEFTIVPELTLPAAAARELASAYAGSGSLLTYSGATLPNPVDSWLYGAARVRERMRDWEQVVLFAGALGKAEPELTPLQLPFDAKDSWMALEFPATMQVEKERLLYTAHFREPFDPSKRQCGLLLDEWTEVIPSAGVTTGVAVHYDRPNNEAPQAMLLLTPPLNTGAWQWRDVVDALSETLDLAKMRAVEPRHLDDTQYARFLPATFLEDFG